MQSIATNPMVQPNLVMPGNSMATCLNYGYLLLTAFSKKVNAFSRKTLLPFGVLMAFLFWGVAAIAQCPTSVEGSITSSSNSLLCSGQSSSININVTPTGGGTYSGSFTNGRTFGPLTPAAGIISPSYTFINNTQASVTENFVLATLIFTPASGTPMAGCPATSTGGSTNITVQPVSDISATLTTPANLCNHGSVSINVSNPNTVGGTYNRSANYNGAGHTATTNATGQAYGTFNDVLTNPNTNGTPITVVYTFTPISPGSLNCVGTPVQVSVTINPNPTITCPANKIQNTDGGVCTAVVNGIDPTFTPATCNGTAPTITYSATGATTFTGTGFASGKTFNRGATTVTYNITDAAGNTGTPCSFTVTINDNELPVISCPGNVSANNATGQCGATVTYPNATATDNCGIQSITYSQNSGTTFPVGTTTVTATATDVNGNIKTCTFTVTVNDTELPMITCPGTITVSNNAGLCSAVVNFTGSNAATATDNCGVQSITYSPASGSTFPKGTTTVTATATDVNGNIKTCTFTVMVNDTELPVITCPGTITVSNDAGQCSAVVNFTGSNAATATDNCGVQAITYSPASGSIFPKGNTTVTATATDVNGNIKTCTFTVTVNDTELPVITCPGNITTTNDAGVCGAIVTYTAPVGTDNCTGATTAQTAGLPSGSTFPIGMTTNTFKVTDASGLTSTCSFTVTVTDNQAPTITCPANITVNNAPAPNNECGAVVNFTGTNAATASDNCPSGVVVTYSPASGTSFPVGTTTVTATATDASMNTATCTFTVTVNNITGNLYVNDGSTTGDHYTQAVGDDVNGNGTKCKPYLTIGKAISVATAGNTIYVDAGTFPENPTVNKALTISGSNAGTAGSGTRSFAESIVRTNGTAGNIFTVSASNVNIDGFTIDGDDPAITGTPTAAGTDGNAGHGVRNSGTTNNLTVKNNIIKNVGIGVRGESTSATNLITRNLFDAIGAYDFGYAITLRTNFYADVTDNKMTRVWTGLHTNNHNTAVGPATWTMSGNEVHSYAAGLAYWLNFNGATGLTVNNNQFSAETGAVTNNIGISVVTLNDAVNATFTNNTITGTEYGMTFTGVSTTNSPILNSTNTISGTTKAAVLVTNNMNFNPVGTTALGNSIQSSTVNINGIGITAASGNGIEVVGMVFTNAQLTTINIGAATTVNGGVTGLLVNGANTAITGNSINNLNFTGQSGNYITLSNNALDNLTITATGSLFDGSTGGAKTLAQNFATEDKITHAIDNASLGFVLVKTGNDFVTTNSGSIQRGVDEASATFTVNVNNGTYTESIDINKTLNIRGAQADACAAIRSGSESIISCANGIGINASNVTLNGFTIQDQTSQAGPGFGYAVRMTPGFTGTSLINNIIKNNIIGSSLANTGSQQVLVQCNWFDANNNAGPASGAGIYTDEYTGGGIISNVMINNNKFSGHDDAGIDISTGSQASATTGISITNNVFTGNYRAAFLYNTNNSSFSNNEISSSTGNGSGDLRIYGGVNSLSVSNNKFAGGAGTPNGIRITDDDAGAISSSITVSQNSFTGYSTSPLAIEVVSGYTGSLMATCNWYGTVNANMVAAQISGPVTYSPYLTDGTDASSATGFQPNPGTCGGTPVVIASAVPSPQTCSGNGSFTVNFSGGNGSYTINYSGPVTGSGTVPANSTSYTSPSTLTAGAYTITVTDANGSFATTTATITYNPVTNVTQSATYTTIQGAINAASANDIIQVCAGTYAENITVNKSLDIRGANYNVDPNGNISRGAESIIVPPVTDLSTSGRAVRVTASNVKINGFTVSGDNPDLPTNGYAIDGTDLHNAYGIFLSGANLSNFEVKNNIVTNFEFAGIRLFGNVATEGHIISNNKIRNLGTYDPAIYTTTTAFGMGISVSTNQYASVTANVINNVSVGIQTESFTLAKPSAGAAVISGNTIAARKRGIFYNLFTTNGSPYTFSSNTITGINNSNETQWQGVLVASQATNGTSTFTNNSIDGTAVTSIPTKGYDVWNVTASAQPIITGGSVSNVGQGIFLNNYEGYPSGGNPGTNATDGTNATISGIAINNSTIGIHVKDNTASTHATVSLTVGTNVVVTGGTTGFKLENSSATVASLTLNNLSFVNIPTNGRYIDLVANATNLDATAVTFDGFTGTTATLAQNFVIEDKIDHKIDSLPLGFVLVKANNTFVTPNSFIAPGTTEPKIQRGVDAAGLTGFIENVQNGTYSDNVNVNKSITILGESQAGTKVKSVTANGNIMTIASNGVTLSTMHLEGSPDGGGNSATRGIYFNSTVSNTAITNVDASLHQYGVLVDNAATVSGVNVTNSSFGANGNGFGVNISGKLSGLTVTNSSFNNNVYGLTSNADPAGANNTAMDNVTVTGTTFTGNTTKGMYFEKLSNASFSGNTFTNNGVNVSSGAGLDVNLKYGSYSGITINGNTFSNNGNAASNGAALAVKARNDAPNYNTLPATLSGTVGITNNEIATAPVGISIGYNVVRTGVSIENNLLTATVAGIVSYSAPAGSTTNAHNNSIDASQYTILNGDASPVSVNATCNWHGTNVAAAVAAKISGNVTYVPYRSDGIDGSTDVGFQPTSACAGSCTSTVTATVTQTTSTCAGSNDGVLTVSGTTGGTAPYTYTISGPANTTGASSGVFTGLAQGTYTITVFEATGCSTVLAPVTVKDIIAPTFTSCPAPITNQQVNSANCQATLSLPAPPATDNCTAPTVSYVLSGATTSSSTAAPITNVSFNVGTTTITYTATDQSGNTATCVTSVTVVNNMKDSIGGTATVVQNNSTTSNITFYASGGTGPYTFTYNVRVNGGSPGANQMVSTTGTNNVVTVPQSNAVVGQYIYTLVSGTDAYGCAAAIASDFRDTITVTATSTRPDFVSAVIRPANANFINGQMKDGYVQINNVAAVPSTGQITFRISNVTNFMLSFPPNMTTSGGDPVNNSDWTITPGAFFYTVTSKPGVVINGGAFSSVGFVMTATGNAGSQGIMTVTILNDTGGSSAGAGDDNNTNNQSIKLFNIN